MESKPSFTAISPISATSYKSILYLKNITTPISHVPFICTGGVNPDTIELFLKGGAVALGTGASILKKELIENEDYDEITRLTKLHFDKIKEAENN